MTKNSPNKSLPTIDPLLLQSECIQNLKDMKKIHNKYTFKIRNFKRMLADYWENTYYQPSY
jgi:hypothetical protein